MSRPPERVAAPVGERLWAPSAERQAASNLFRFMEQVRAEYAPELRSYQALYQWSLEHPERFWPAVWAYCGIEHSQPWERVFTDSPRMPGTKWFEGARLNFAENLLRARGGDGGDRLALVFRDERGARETLTYAELEVQVARCAAGLRATGVGPGDRVAGFMPNRPEAVVAMLATASLGAIWSSCSPDFGIGGVLDRFGQIEPKVLFTCDGYAYAGKAVDSVERIKGVLEQLPSVRRVVLVPYLHQHPDPQRLPQGVLWSAFCAVHEPLRFAQLPFDHPLYILYSSGTTGAPKCIVHGAGGTLLQHLKELVLHTDLKHDDAIFYFTTCGWMMWNWLVSGLGVGATVVLYEGSPFHPDPGVLWRLAEEEGVAAFGTSAKYLAALEKAGYSPRAHQPLARLRTLLSTGSPLLPESFDFAYREVKADLQLSSIAGGTDIVSCFVLGNPLLPVHRGEIQCRGLGMAVEVWDDAGKPLRGEPGELVCTAPFPSMPLGFWKDDDGARYRGVYFERFPGVWHHGDWVELTLHDGVVIHGRSDAVLNPGGVRIGTAEIYRQVERLDEVVESLAVGQDWEGDVRVVLFVVLRGGHALDALLTERIKRTIRDSCTPRHVPAKVIQVPELPRTISGKLVELAVRNLIHGRPVRNLDALANPKALEHFRDLPELRS